MSTYQPTYATITIDEINYLLEKDAPKQAITILLALNAYCMDGFSCFPSLRTISQLLKNRLSMKTIQRALKWLADNFVIQRNHKQSRKRFVNLIRKMVYGEKQRDTGCPTTGTQNVPIKEPTEKKQLPSISPYKGRQQTNKKRKSIEQRLNSAKKRVQRYTNLLQERIPPTPANKETDNLRSLLSYQIAMRQMKAEPEPMTQEQMSKIRILCQTDESMMYLATSSIEVSKLLGL